MPGDVRDGGAWKDLLPGTAVRDGGSWKDCVGMWVRDGGSWKKFFSLFIGTLRPDTTVSNSWQTTGGGSAHNQIDEATPDGETSKIFESTLGNDSASPSCEVTLDNPSSEPSSGSPHTLRVNARQQVSGSPSVGLDVSLREGGVNVATLSPSLGVTYSNYSHALTQSEIDSISDYDALTIAIFGSLSSGAGESAQLDVSQVEFEIG